MSLTMRNDDKWVNLALFLANSCDQFTRRTGFDFPGFNLEPTAGIVVPDYATCCAQCKTKSDCLAFVFNTQLQRCYLKYSIFTGGRNSTNGTAGYARKYAFPRKKEWVLTDQE